MMVVFIFSDAGKYITGTVFIVDGGAWHQYSPKSRPLQASVTNLDGESNGRSNITGGFKYPDMLLQGTGDLNVTGKKKSKL